MKIAVAMSGGVDSSFVAVNYKNMGHEVLGFTARMLKPETSGSEEYERSLKSIEDAKTIAQKFDFQHEVIDLQNEFHDNIINYFCAEYAKGRTPSPCIMCNAKIKFGKLLDFAKANNCDKLATGHYARITSYKDRLTLAPAVDIGRDQTYFLFMLSQDVLRDILFPLGEYNKADIRRISEEYGISVAKKGDSQDICFISAKNYAGFVESHTKAKHLPGDIVNSKGEIIGRHKGIYGYTIGQRRGMGISSPVPLYVTGIDIENNRVIAGFKDELYCNSLFAKDITYMGAASFNELDVFVKTRSTQKPFKAKLEEKDNGVYARFYEPQMQITPGQASVFYDSEGYLLGGAWIERGLH